MLWIYLWNSEKFYHPIPEAQSHSNRISKRVEFWCGNHDKLELWNFPGCCSRNSSNPRRHVPHKHYKSVIYRDSGTEQFGVSSDYVGHKWPLGLPVPTFETNIELGAVHDDGNLLPRQHVCEGISLCKKVVSRHFCRGAWSSRDQRLPPGFLAVRNILSNDQGFK